MKWPIKIFVLAVCLSMLFGIFAELILINAGIVISCIILSFLITISVITDMIGVAATAASIDKFKNKTGKGVGEAIYLVKNADKVASLVSDVIGDVCGILSGACGAAIVVKIAIEQPNGALGVIVASLVSALIAGITILFKALGKSYSIKNANKIVLVVGKLLSFFVKRVV